MIPDECALANSFLQSAGMCVHFELLPLVVNAARGRVNTILLCSSLFDMK